jgi:CHASE2 domain-containing sensor protein
MARQIALINQFKPKVIAIDGLLNCEGGLRDSINCPALLDTLGNLLLASAIQEAGNVVVAEKLLQTDSLSGFDSELSDSLEFADSMFRINSKDGFVNFPTDATYQEDVKLCRTVWPQYDVKGKKELAFATQIAMQYDSVKTMRFLRRNKDEEIINYRGNIEVLQLRIKSLKNSQTGTTNFATMFYAVDVGQLENGEVLGDVFKNSIVMMGYLGDYLGQPSWEDKFYTPLNKKIAGRANPDMFGLVVHANVVAMILNEDYVNELPDWLLITIAFVICTLAVALLIVIDHNLPTWFDALSFFVQIVIIYLLMMVIIEVFAQNSLKLDLSLTVAAIAVCGPCYDVFKSLENEYNKRFTKRRAEVLKNT